MTVNEAAQCAGNRYFPLATLKEAESRLRSAGMKSLASRLALRIATIEDVARREYDRELAEYCRLHGIA